MKCKCAREYQGQMMSDQAGMAGMGSYFKVSHSEAQINIGINNANGGLYLQGASNSRRITELILIRVGHMRTMSFPE